MTESTRSRSALAGLDAIMAELEDLYRDVHAHPELSMQEHRTAGKAAERLQAAGYTVTTGVGGTGVVGLLSNGDDPTVMLRADVDALPIKEATGLPTPARRRRPTPPGMRFRSCTRAGTTCTSPGWPARRRCSPGPATPGTAPCWRSSSQPKRPPRAPRGDRRRPL